MVLFVGAKSFKSEMGVCFSNICKDPNVEVRKTLSAGFHEVSLFSLVCTESISAPLCRQLLAYRSNLESVPGTNQYCCSRKQRLALDWF